ncbi:MAG: DUF3078 domain-containing protein [Muribaculaceae bacterium]|nr:DUF3078 domain-containing protein [Muribaculaceae bacterium]
MASFSDKTLICSAVMAAAAAFSPATEAQNAAEQPRFRHVNTTQSAPTRHEVVMKKYQNAKDSILAGVLDSAMLRIRDPREIIEETVVTEDIPTFNRLLAPWVFSGFHPLENAGKLTTPSLQGQMPQIWRTAGALRTAQLSREERKEADSIAERRRYLDELWGVETTKREELKEAIIEEMAETYAQPSPLLGDPTPSWLTNARNAWTMQEDMMYGMMVDTPSKIQYSYWQLPVPPTLPEDDHGFTGFLKRTFISDVNAGAQISEAEVLKKHWLHVVNGAIQFSQAYISNNWYQGGNNHLALLINFLWDVQLNSVWHPNLLLQSTLSYKLGLNSVEDDQYRKYSISQDIFQYNFKFGYKARRNWYYTVTAQFKTQLLNNYKKNTQTRIASILTPGDLNLGVGMTYSKTNKKKTVQFNASIAPLSYNLKTAISPSIDHGLFGMEQEVKTQSEIGSNADITLNWQIGKMVTYKSRLFLFTDYKYFLSDWENTLNIQFSKLFSTQIYANLRYDSSADIHAYPKWNRFMLKEILSIGLSYTFSTKQ